MKKIIVSSLLIFCCVVSTGCATVLGGAAGSVIDKSLGGNGDTGMIAGAAIGTMIAKAHADRKITVGKDGEIAMRCQNHYSYRTNGGNAVMTKDCDGASIERMQTNNFPKPPTPSYGLPPDASIAGTTSAPCRRYNTDGTMNADCR